MELICAKGVRDGAFEIYGPWRPPMWWEMDCLRACSGRSVRIGRTRIGMSCRLRAKDRRPCFCIHAISRTAAPVITSKPPESNIGVDTAATSRVAVGACRSAGAPNTECAPSTAETASVNPESVIARAAASRRVVRGASMSSLSVSRQIAIINPDRVHT